MSSSPSPELIQALADAVSTWRMQEYTCIAFYCFYVYYVLTTLAEEISIIWPQKWNRGKTLYTLIRYGVLVYIALCFSRDYRTYFTISPKNCKVVMILTQAVFYVIILACDFSLALCLSALLEAKMLFFVSITALSCALPFIYTILNVIGAFQLPPQPVSPLDIELGYACYYVTYDQWAEETVMYLGQDIRSYLNLAATILLSFLGVATLVVRYRGQSGGLVKVIRRDGGMHYLSLIVIRLLSTIVATRTIVPSEELDSSPASQVFNVANEVILPILAQRLLINMRKVDYIGSQPVASKLLFAPMTIEASKNDAGSLQDSSGTHVASSDLCRDGAAEAIDEKRRSEEGDRNA